MAACPQWDKSAELESHLKVELCKAARLAEQDRNLEAEAAFAALLRRYAAALSEARFRYLYEDLQCRRALALCALERYNEAIPILREAKFFAFDTKADKQRVHFLLGLCLQETGDHDSARAELCRVLSFNLMNAEEEQALWRLAIYNYRRGALAQAKEQLERLLRDFRGGNPAISRKHVYEMLARIFQHLGDSQQQRHYTELTKRTLTYSAAA
ncbi:MAG TPA: tetratricopeptide repeat protein [Terriglobales bacterium]|nr:tetratricopeptide repeat protein [Terriglobales bacterium]